ncbi:fimbrial protein TcfD, partial [Salmonella enterica subsp. enterica serovar Worthington]|nr:fimbrial protein TcfD [Salmonella enterica subsp. enterica serovar Worthington]EKF6935175.1 fimbrial protein TcfD [Salmonella enterica subsp. enterica serovar Worthington]ELK1546264.1 fimbrial protein TcfD [Salmonella enterica subsp. enterica serovar Worthington]
MSNKMKWTKINHYLHPKICSACAILLMAGATLPQVADAETTYDRTSTVDLNYDRSNVLGFERMFEQYINTNYLGWVCRSNSNENEGACDDTNLIWHKRGVTKIRLRFREQISHAETTLILDAHAGGPCGYFTINGAINCVYPSNYVTAGISAEELAKIPKAGIWKATLVLDVHRWPDGKDGKVGVWTTDITLNVTDHFAENAAIYFPQFGTATPRVDLNLHRMNASQMSGRANLDMCLYDGGVKARSLQMKIEGSNKSGTGFQVIKSDSADTIDYAVSMNYGGRSIPVTRGVEFSLDNVDKAATRPVVLPGQRQAVRCVPVPLTLTTQPFNIREKRSGEYQGTLTVTMLMGT